MILQTNVNAGSRLASLVIDVLTFMAACFGFFIITLIIDLFKPLTVKANEVVPYFVTTPLLMALSLGLTFYLCKDGINGRSIGKNMLQNQVVRNTTREAASPLRCLIRNLFCLFWPLELIITLANPSRRLGDIVAGTKVVTYYPPTTAQPKVSFIKVMTPVIICIATFFTLAATYPMFIHSLPVKTVVNTLTSNDDEYDRTAYNKAESEALEKLYSDSLGNYLTARVKIFDPKVTHASCKTIYIEYQLNENYLKRDRNISGDIALLRILTEKQLYSVYPANTFTGEARYVLKEDTTQQIQMNAIGTAKE